MVSKKKSISNLHESFLSRNFGKILTAIGILLLAIVLLPLLLHYIHYTTIKNKFTRLKNVSNSHSFTESYTFPESDKTHVIVRDEDIFYTNTTLRSPYSPCEKLIIDLKWQQAHENNQATNSSINIYSDTFWRIFWIVRVAESRSSYFGPFVYAQEAQPGFNEYYQEAMNKFLWERNPFLPVEPKVRCKIL